MRERKCTEIRKEEIVRAALSLVEQNGLDKLNINDIATKIGLVPASIYRHFKGKDEIIMALIEFADSSLKDNLIRAKACDGTAIDKLEMLFRLHIKLLREEAAIPRILFFLMSSNRNPEIKRKLSKAANRVEKVVMMQFRKDLEQQRKWRAEIMKSRKQSSSSK